MKIDLNQELTDLDGEVLRDRVWDEDKYGQPKKDEQGNILFKRPKWTLKRICEFSLIAPAQEVDERTGREKIVSEETKIKMYHLAQDIHASNGLIDFEDGAVTLLKDLICRKYTSPLMVGRAFDALEPLKEKKK